MIRTAFLAALALVCVTLMASGDAEARQRHGNYPASDQCNLTGPNAMACEGVAPSPRGEYIARRLGFGGARKIYMPRSAVEKPAWQRKRGFAEKSRRSGYGGGGMVAQARSYIGTNPTGWRRLWCGRFIAMVAPQAAARVGNPNMAKAYLALPRTSGNIGDLAVMGRRGGGHIGIVTGFDARGNPVIVSGNAGGGIVREGIYARGRILAFVSAG